MLASPKNRDVLDNAAELFYLAAEVRLDHLDDVSGAEADLAHAVARDPTHLKATKRLKDIRRPARARHGTVAVLSDRGPGPCCNKGGGRRDIEGP